MPLGKSVVRDMSIASAAMGRTKAITEVASPTCLVNFLEEIVPDTFWGVLSSNISHYSSCFAVLTHYLFTQHGVDVQQQDTHTHRHTHIYHQDAGLEQSIALTTDSKPDQKH